ncbi:hypothetical protein F4805DRAFT_106784 [Annulohypoxylon moriforme]|nr:hypothetical protein F4805DRAFT_106784 [Annulohypoxylon moriforme]
MAHLLASREKEQKKDVIRFGVDHLDDSTIAKAIVMLRFKKSGSEKGGNGFFINIPGQDKSIILTAGHNLIDEKGDRTTNLKAWWQGVTKWTEISERDTRISKVYSNNPTGDSAIDDFGIIILNKNNDPPLPNTAFGFSLRLDEEGRLDSQCNISSYLTEATMGDTPIRSTGSFVNPIMNENQLEYLVPTEAGVSGSAIWVGYNGSPIAVAVHNYGPKRRSPKYGSLGSRINLKMMQEVLEWTGAYKRAVNILAQPVKKQKRPEFPLCLAWSEQDEIIRVRVQGESDLITDESIFEVLPVFSSATLEGKTKSEEYGFARPDNSPGAKKGARCWVSWNVEPPTASLTSIFSRARRASWKVKGTTACITILWHGDLWDVVVRTDEEVVAKGDLAFPGIDYTGVAYQNRSGASIEVSAFPRT